MAKLIQVILGMSIFLPCACATSEVSVGREVHAFLQLLVEKNEPTLAEFTRFSGDGDPSELELAFELKECNSKGWDSNAKPCMDFIRNRWRSADKETSLFLSWLRKRFSTVDSSYRIINVESKTEGFSHSLIELEIGKNRFLLFHNTDPSKPTGLCVGVSQVNGMKISEYF